MKHLFQNANYTFKTSMLVKSSIQSSLVVKLSINYIILVKMIQHQFIVRNLSFTMECNPVKTLKDTHGNKKVLISAESFGTKIEFCVHVLSYKLYRSFMMYQSFNFSRHEVVIIIASLKATFVFVDKLKNNTSTKMLFL